MFRNVTSAQEAIAHRLSENSSTHEKRQEKLIQDIQSDNIAQSYTTLRSQWIHQREQLIENLKSLEKHDASLNEIQHVKNLIDCLNQLVENGEITKNCQTIINDLDKYIHLVPEAYLLTRKPLGNKMIRLPRHISKTKTDITHSMKTTSSEILHTQQSNEKLTDQTALHDDSNQKRLHSTFDVNESTVSRVSRENMTSGMQFYVIAEPFYHKAQKHTSNNRYASSTILE